MQLRCHKHLKIVSPQIISVYFSHIAAKQFVIGGTALHIAWISPEAQVIQSIRRTCILLPQWATELNVQQQA